MKSFWFRLKIKFKEYFCQHAWEYTFEDSNRYYYCVKCGKDYHLP